MLKISNNRIDHRLNAQNYKSLKRLEQYSISKWPLRLFFFFAIVSIIALFLPWTQNIQAKGYITTLQPNQRPQAIQSVISGRLEQWYVTEGDFVKKGDTIVFITEVKSEYFDPELIQRTEEQVDAKSQSVDGYASKVKALEAQYEALLQARDFKIEQTKNKIEQTVFKIKADSTDLIAQQLDQQIAQQQYERTSELYDKGLKSLTELETKRMKLQETQAKVISQQNKLEAMKRELQNLRIAIPAITSDYADKMAKSQSDKFSAVTGQMDASANTSKLRNQLSNYEQRQKLYYIIAPQSGYITKAIQKGVGEIIKEGTDIITIMPEKYDYAVELYVRPIDLPLLEKGQRVQLLFDGWPAVAFRGWPNTSTGTFQGQVFAIDQFISDNGKYRIMVSPSDESDKQWPTQLRVGSGARSFILLNNVPLWYEAWRQLNGFPPDFYANEKEQEKIKRKAPLKSVK